jgi:radical SAM protein with 4Fe4S-binding SPASM domain
MKEQYNFAPENMNLDTYNKIINQLKAFPNKLKVLSLTGQGEPLINKNIAEMIKIAKEADIAERIEIISNASLLTPEMSKKLIDAGLDTIRISLQGLSSSKYKEICDFNLDFDKLIENIKYFYDNIMQCNVFVKVMDVALENGEDKEFYDTFSNISDRMYIEQCRPVYDGVEFTKGLEVIADRYGREHKKREVCPLPFFMLGIFPDGDVEPCDTIYKPVIIGNVNNETLMEMWKGNKLRDFQILQLSKQRGCNSKCQVCCAPDDVSHPEDLLDDSAEEILKRL